MVPARARYIYGPALAQRPGLDDHRAPAHVHVCAAPAAAGRRAAARQLQQLPKFACVRSYALNVCIVHRIIPRAVIFSISTARPSALVACGAEKQLDEAAVELFDARSAPRIDDVKRADWGRMKEEWKNIQ